MKKGYNLLNLLNDLWNEKIALPSIQRGFVWKPYQIETLWDSVLRGYPIGAFTIQEKDDIKNLLDGQQRLTALALGLNIKNKTLNAELDSYQVFIDLYKPDEVYNEANSDDDLDYSNQDKLYYIKVITKYHPWGYRFKENEKPLQAHHIDSALDLFGVEKTDSAQKRFNNKLEPMHYPYDTYFPIPLKCFIEENENGVILKDFEKVNVCIHEWINGLDRDIQAEFFRILNYIEDKNFNFYEDILNKKPSKKDEITDFRKVNISSIPTLQLRNLFSRNIEKDIDARESVLFYTIKEIHEKLNQALTQTNIAFIDVNTILDEQKEQSTVDIEHIFERLNRGGTAISLEELNYSLFKSKFSMSGTRNKNVIKNFEAACTIISPARFLPIMFRLYEHKNNNSIATRLRIKSKDFKKNVLSGEKKEDFLDFLSKTSNFLDLYQEKMLYTKGNKNEISDKKDNKNGIPYSLLVKIVTEAPELLFMALYRLEIKKDKLENPDKLIYLTLTLYWFFGGHPRKKFPQLLSLIFPAMKNLPEERFYSYETIQRAVLNLEKYENLMISTERLEEITKEQLEDSNYRRIIENKDFLLYAQREALFKWFENEYFDAKDTNRPFDYDHIMPHNWVKGKKKISNKLRDIYNTNGNFRAWPYADNRKDQDDSPCLKLSLDENNYSLCSADWRNKNITSESCRKPKMIATSPEIKIIWERNKYIYLAFIANAEKQLNLASYYETDEAENILTITSLFADIIESKNTSDKTYENICKDVYDEENEKSITSIDDNELCFIAGLHEGSAYHETFFGITGEITDDENNRTEKLNALSEYVLWVSRTYLKDNTITPEGFTQEGNFITLAIELNSLSQQAFNDFIDKIYDKLIKLEKHLKDDSNLADEFKIRLNSSQKRRLTRKANISK